MATQLSRIDSHRTYGISEPIRFAESRELFVYVTAGEDSVPEHLWAPCFTGKNMRRQKVWPNCIAVTWARRNHEPWRLNWLSVHVVNRYNTSTSVEPGNPIEQWILNLIMPHAPEGWQLQ
jgi:hypothetical protein